MNGSAVLRLVAGIPAPGDAGHVHRFAVGPDAANAGDFPFAERDREGGVVEILGRLDLGPATLAATLACGLRFLAEIRRPDDVAADPHPAVKARDHGPFGRGGDAQPVEPRALDALGGREGRHDPVVDQRPDARSDKAADGCGAYAKKSAANGSTDRGANRAEYKRCHVRSFRCGPRAGTGRRKRCAAARPG